MASSDVGSYHGSLTNLQRAPTYPFAASAPGEWLPTLVHGGGVSRDDSIPKTQTGSRAVQPSLGAQQGASLTRARGPATSSLSPEGLHPEPLF